MIEFLVRGLLTALGVALVLHAVRRVSLLAGGAVAGLPVTTLPALLWLAATRGEAFAAQAAIGSVISAAAWSACAAGYVVAASRARPLVALTAALLLALALVAASSGFQPSAGAALALAALVSAVAQRRLRRAADTRLRVGAACGSPWLAPTAAGAASALVGALAPVLPPLACGLLASLPIIGLAGAWVQHRHGGLASVAPFARGYVAGLLAKAGFCAVFAELLLRLHWPLALTAAAATAVLSGAVVAAWTRIGAQLAARRP
ncbi:MAG: hypothetical protein MUC86_10700 [Burkholderiaceae bacterium]|nr:hypothetical protein [Burkholderiaceae bacterium]